MVREAFVMVLMYLGAKSVADFQEKKAKAEQRFDEVMSLHKDMMVKVDVVNCELDRICGKRSDSPAFLHVKRPR